MHWDRAELTEASVRRVVENFMVKAVEAVLLAELETWARRGDIYLSFHAVWEVSKVPRPKMVG